MTKYAGFGNTVHLVYKETLLACLYSFLIWESHSIIFSVFLLENNIDMNFGLPKPHDFPKISIQC